MARRIRCAHCKTPDGHETVAQVKLCAKRAAQAALDAAYQEEGHLAQQAEMEAELRNERFWEERGANEDDPRERYLQMLEDEHRDDAEIARREIEADQAAAVAKMDRSFSLAGTRRRRPW